MTRRPAAMAGDGGDGTAAEGKNDGFQKMPFDVKRMAYGGFSVLVEV